MLISSKHYKTIDSSYSIWYYDMVENFPIHVFGFELVGQYPLEGWAESASETSLFVIEGNAYILIEGEKFILSKGDIFRISAQSKYKVIPYLDTNLKGWIMSEEPPVESKE